LDVTTGAEAVIDHSLSALAAGILERWAKPSRWSPGCWWPLRAWACSPASCRCRIREADGPW